MSAPCPPTTVSTLTLPIGLLLVCGTVWGGTIPLTKVAVSTGHAPMGLIFWQTGILAVATAVVLLLRRERVRLSPRHLGYYALIGVFGTIAPSSVSFAIADRVPAGFLGLILATVPMFSLLIALAIRSERFRPDRMLGIALGVLAMMMLAIPEARLPGAGMAPVLLLGLLAPLCYGLEGNIVERLAPADTTPVGVIFASSALSVPVAGVIAWFGEGWVDLGITWGAAEWALVLSSLGHAAAYTGYVALVGLAGAVFSSQISYVVTLSAILFSLIFLGEAYPATAWLAIAIMMLGLALVQPAGKLPEP